MGTTALVLLPAALGAAMRYRSNSLLRDMDQVKVREREQLCNDMPSEQDLCILRRGRQSCG